MKAYPLRDISTKLWHRLKIQAVNESRSMRAIIIQAIEEYLNRHAK